MKLRGAMRTSLRSWPRALPYARPHKPLIGGSLGLMLVASAVQLAEPWPLALMVDSILGDKPLPNVLDDIAGDGRAGRIALVASLGLVVTLLVHGVAVVSQYLNTKLDMRMVLSLRSQLFQHVQRLSFAFHDERRTGEFMGRINGQASSVGQVVVGVFPLLQSGLTLVGMFYVAYRLNPTVALVSLTVVPFVYYSTGYYGTRIGPQIRDVKRMEMRSLHLVHEAMQMLRVIVAFNREDHEHEKFRAQAEEAVDARVRVTVKQMLFSLCVNLVTSGGTALVLGVGAWQVLDGELTVGRLLVLMSYIAAVYRPIETISTTLTGIQENLIGFELALELLDTPAEIVEKPDARELARAEGRVTFDHVSFAYTGRDHTLVDMSFEVAPGRSIAIVGPTGAGKTTMASLVPRFYDPHEGRVLIDGIDVRDLTMASLRAQISIVLQEPLLFTGSIADNIRYGRLDATQAEIEDAARAANAHEFIMKLPKQYRTKLGERGAKLSGGERQRLAVARAFLKDAPILVLDEPTSSIDSQTEGVILEALQRLMRGRTTIMIAHRLSTVRNMSQILVVDDGRIVERGTHEELLAAGGLYRKLYDLQNVLPPDVVDRVDAASRRLSDVAAATGLRGRALRAVLNVLEREPVGGSTR